MLDEIAMRAPHELFFENTFSKQESHFLKKTEYLALCRVNLLRAFSMILARCLPVPDHLRAIPCFARFYEHLEQI